MIKKAEKNEIKSLAHSKYRCQYHIVFAPKYRRQEIYGQIIGTDAHPVFKNSANLLYQKAD